MFVTKTQAARGGYHHPDMNITCHNRSHDSPVTAAAPAARARRKACCLPGLMAPDDGRSRPPPLPPGRHRLSTSGQITPR